MDLPKLKKNNKNIKIHTKKKKKTLAKPLTLFAFHFPFITCQFIYFIYFFTWILFLKMPVTAALSTSIDTESSAHLVPVSDRYKLKNNDAPKANTSIDSTSSSSSSSSSASSSSTTTMSNNHSAVSIIDIIEHAIEDEVDDEFDYEALPENTSLSANLIAGATAGIMVRI